MPKRKSELQTEMTFFTAKFDQISRKKPLFDLFGNQNAQKLLGIAHGALQSMMGL